MRAVAEYSANEFMNLFPEMWKDMPLYLKIELINDDNYILRVKPTERETLVEIGYREDNWYLN